MKPQNHTCPNPTCGKTFTKPLKAENLSYGTLVIYEACPYCLTEIAVDEAVPSVEQKPATVEKDVAKMEPETTQEAKTSLQQPSVETSSCKHYFGYLSERSSRDNLPEECMVCPNIVQCMLKGVTG
ncbi:MAG: hypothetical protein NZ932_00805 [Candidatus Bathyarchaeota archaeon]|nr:hypothetical protein [Candidatus Bathyarchaeota archaeon]MDW8040179.1 hypothetical protein [Nitrososphaerota archaeon]